jgi:exopolysaccharide biosynthesis polyprenyl glycosylphosphotransferase
MRRPLRLDGERLVLLAVDALSIAGVTALTWWLRFRSGLFAEPEPFQLHPAVHGALALYWISIFALRGQYRKLYRISRFRSLQEVFASTVTGIALLFVLTLDPQRPFGPGRLLLLHYGLMLFLGAGLGRVLFRTAQKRLLERGVGLRPALVVGDGERAGQVLEQFRRHPGMGFLPLGRVAVAAPDGGALGSLGELDELIRRHQALEVVVTVPEREVLFEAVRVGTARGAEVHIVPDLYDLVLGHVKAFDVWGLPLIQVFPHLMAPWQFLLKRLLDLAVSGLGLLLSLPLWLLLPPLIRRDSPGAPALYRQRRVGRGGREFELLKFRTMVPGADLGPEGAAPPRDADDPRITRLGRWLRRYRIDELPQLWNIFLGRMSLVGPRPEQRAFVEEYTRRWPLWARRHNVRPGLTGWAQVKQAYDQSVGRPDDKLRLDLFYLENMSLSLDLKILLFTVRTVLRGAGR